jgi:hypothetical protein
MYLEYKSKGEMKQKKRRGVCCWEVLSSVDPHEQKKGKVQTNNVLKGAPKKALMCKRPFPHQMNFKIDQILLPLSTVYQTPKNAHIFAIPFVHYPQGPWNVCVELRPQHV